MISTNKPEIVAAISLDALWDDTDLSPEEIIVKTGLGRISISPFLAEPRTQQLIGRLLKSKPRNKSNTSENRRELCGQLIRQVESHRTGFELRQDWRRETCNALADNIDLKPEAVASIKAIKALHRTAIIGLSSTLPRTNVEIFEQSLDIDTHGVRRSWLWPIYTPPTTHDQMEAVDKILDLEGCEQLDVVIGSPRDKLAFFKSAALGLILGEPRKTLGKLDNAIAIYPIRQKTGRTNQPTNYIFDSTNFGGSKQIVDELDLQDRIQEAITEAIK